MAWTGFLLRDWPVLLESSVKPQLQQPSVTHRSVKHDLETCYSKEKGSECLQLHLLIGGVWTLHAAGMAKARVRFTVTPNEKAPTLTTKQRHAGWDRTTLASWEQHEEEAVEVFPAM
ncbi:hypothetical protein BHE74_00029298 [Ensete ventricosum]|nr:hypothetical protein GW17_00008839 [Ensete ventricosum]RWW63518.1 hypothetical protein BHE74_00029298 [Ensete ventricosum]